MRKPTKPKLKSKQLWEMTQAEYLNRILAYWGGFTRGPAPLTGLRDSSGAQWLEIGKTGIYQGEVTSFLKSLETGQIREWPHSEVAKMDRVPLTHKDLVKLALSEGKPVPAEVLADYPDLAGKSVKGANNPMPRVIRKLLRADQISDFKPTDKVARVGDKTNRKKRMN